VAIDGVYRLPFVCCKTVEFMVPRCIFYLAVEDALLPRNAGRPGLLLSEVDSLRDSAHAGQLTALLTGHEHIGVVVNSLWVISLGFHFVLDTFPSALRHRVIGATVPGNRMLRSRRLTDTPGRCACLAADVKRRELACLTVLDSDALHVPVPLRDDAVIVQRGLWAAQPDDWTRLRDTLARTA